MTGLSFEWDLSPEKSMDSFLPMFSTGFSSFSVLLLFRIDHLLHLYPWFLMLFHLTQMRLSLSTHLLRCLSLETLFFIIRTSILVDRHDSRERKFPWKLYDHFFSIECSWWVRWNWTDLKKAFSRNVGLLNDR